MSRSALVMTRWSKTKPPLSAPATRRSAGSHRRRSGWANIFSARSSGGTRAGYPQPQRVEVAVEGVGLALGRLAAHGAGDIDEVGALGERIAFPGRLDVARQAHRQLLDGDRHRPASLAVDDRDRRPPVALAGDREV